jgi:hypothetical protein
MGREHTVEGRTGGTSSVVQPAFQLVGAYSVGKGTIVEELTQHHFTEKLGAYTIADNHVRVNGLLTDYRNEIRLAAKRATAIHSSVRPMIYTHSLIDSLAYSLMRVDAQQEANVSERIRETWALTMGLIGCMLRDTHKADETFFIMADFDPATHYDQAKLQETLGIILDGYEIPYTILDTDAEGVVDDIATVIGSYIPA